MTTYEDIQVERLVRQSIAKLDQSAADSAHRMLDDLLSSADGHWRARSDVEADVHAFLDQYEQSRPQLIEELRQNIRAEVAALVH